MSPNRGTAMTKLQQIQDEFTAHGKMQGRVRPGVGELDKVGLSEDAIEQLKSSGLVARDQ